MLFSLFIPVQIVLLFTISVQSKTLHFQSTDDPALFSSGMTDSEIARSEQRLSAAFNRSSAKRAANDTSTRLSDADLINVFRMWHHLSDGFKKKYLEATAIPTDFSHMPSPGGHFLVFYTTTDEYEEIDSTDNYGYGGGSDWRIKINEPNGVPDYADEVAWALDSSWSMEIDRFGFVAPIDTNEITADSGRYRVIIRPPHNNKQNYGMTYPQLPFSDSGPGFSSYIEINNDWTLPSYREMQYDKHPEWAIRVTCAHEFFHAIHYAMAWQVRNQIFLDDYPVSWLEGTAVLMEELAFDSINDYLQYATNFFYSPGMSFLSQYGDYDYVNSILTKYLYEKVSRTPRIDFIFDMFYRNHNEWTPFHDNLQIASGQSGKTWVGILNRFHTESFFTNDRSNEHYFISDALLFPKWSYTRLVTDEFTKKVTQVKPYGMCSFGISPGVNEPDTVQIHFSGETQSQDTIVSRWGVSAIIRKQSSDDTIVTIPVKNDGNGELTFQNWHEVSEVVMVITSGYTHANREAKIEALYNCTEQLSAGDTLNLTVIAADKRSSAQVRVTASMLPACIPTLREYDSTISPSPLNEGDLSPVSSLFSCTYPSNWTEGAALVLSVSISGPTTKALDDAALYHFNTVDNIWKQLPSTFSRQSDTCTFRTELESSGIFAILKPKAFPDELVAYPNPVRLCTNKPVHFFFKDIQELRIYNLNGTLLCGENDHTHSSSLHRYADGIMWYPSGHGTSGVVPGTYYAIVINKNDSGLMKSIRKKIIVTP